MLRQRCICSRPSPFQEGSIFFGRGASSTMPHKVRGDNKNSSRDCFTSNLLNTRVLRASVLAWDLCRWFSSLLSFFYL